MPSLYLRQQEIPLSNVSISASKSTLMYSRNSMAASPVAKPGAIEVMQSVQVAREDNFL